MSEIQDENRPLGMDTESLNKLSPLAQIILPMLLEPREHGGLGNVKLLKRVKDGIQSGQYDIESPSRNAIGRARREIKDMFPDLKI